MSRIDEQQLQDHFRQAKATLAVEGLYLTEKEEDLVLMRQRNEISQDEFLRRALLLVREESNGGY